MPKTSSNWNDFRPPWTTNSVLLALRELKLDPILAEKTIQKNPCRSLVSPYAIL